MSNKIKIIRVTTVPQSLRSLLKGQMKFMTTYFKVLGISSDGEALKEVKTNENIDVLPVEMTRTISPLKDLRAVWKLYIIFKREKPYIVHSHTPKAGILGMLAAWLAKVPIRLHTVAGLPLLVATGHRRRLLDLVEKITYRCASKVYPNSFGLYDIILQNEYTQDEKLKVIANGSSNGIDTGFFSDDNVTEAMKIHVKSDLKISEDDFIFVFVGRLVKDKGLNELIAAFRRLSKEFTNVKLLLVGKFERELDPLLPDTELEIRDNNRIIEVGFQVDVRPYFSISHVLTFPSYREGFPNVVMQAGAMGVPSIVSDINGCNEIIVPDQNGIIVPARNTELLYEKMKACYLNPEKTQKMAINSRKLIRERYEQNLVWEELLKEYQYLIKCQSIDNV